MNGLHEKMHQLRQEAELKHNGQMEPDQIFAQKTKESTDWLYNTISLILQEFVDGDENLALSKGHEGNTPNYTITYRHQNPIYIVCSGIPDHVIVRATEPHDPTQGHAIYEGDLNETELRNKLEEFLLSWYKTIIGK